VIRSPRDLDVVSNDRRDSFRHGMRDPLGALPGDAPPPGAEAGYDLGVEAAPARTSTLKTRQEAVVGEAKVTTTETVTTEPVPAPVKATVTTKETVTTEPAPKPSKSAAPRDESTYRHTTDDKNKRIYPLDKDTRERAPF
jgi:hypothetical protein